MAIDVCSSCGGGNLATQYIEQLTERVQLARHAAERHCAADNRAIPLGGENRGPTVNSLGATVGLLVNATA